MSAKHVSIGDIDCGSNDLFLIAGLCVIEEESMMLRTAERLKGIAGELGISVIFKSSFSKDNRSSLDYYQGPGLDEGLRILERIKRELELPSGSREFLSVLSRAGVAAGVDGIFIEAHPSPPDALCDAASQYYLEELADFVRPLLEIHDLVRNRTVH